MTGVQTCALPICFPVTIAAGANMSGNIRIIERRIDELERAIRLRDWTGVEWEFDRVKRAVTKYKREELTTKEIRTWD